jgi:hypothetical protein
MGIMDLFSGKQGRNAAIWQMQNLQNVQNQALGSLDTGLDQGLGALRGGYADALASLRQFYPESQSYSGQATDAWNPLIQRGQTGIDAYMDATGANGAEGSGRAFANFRADPGYKWQRNQGIDSLNRAAAARGMLGSGNQTTDILKYSQGLADQTYGNYVSRLAPFLSLYGTGVAGQAGGLTNQATLAAGEGAREAGVQTGLGSAIASLYGNNATNRANILSNIGQEYGKIGAGGMQAGQQADANMLSLLGGGLGLVGKLAGMPTSGGGSFGGSLLSRLFG